MATRNITTLAWHAGTLEWTTLTEQTGGWTVTGHGVQPAADDASDAARARTDAIRAFAPFWIVLPTAQTLLRVVTLPTAEEAELRGMAELQLDRFSPFAAEGMVVTLEVLARHEKSTRVLLAAAQRDAVAAVATPLLAAGLLPSGVSVGVLGWWHSLRAAGHLANQGCECVVIMTAAGVDLMALRDGQPLLFRTLGPLTAEGEDLNAELDFALISLESEWGVTPEHLTVWHDDRTPATLMDALKIRPGMRVVARDLATLPSLTEGVARYVAGAREVAVNLVLPDWVQAARQRKLRRRWMAVLLAIAGLWGLTLLTLIVGSQWRQRGVARSQRELASLEQPAAEIRQQQELVRLLQQYANPSGSALECLRHISEALPEDVKIASLTYNKAQSIAVRGEAVDAQNVYVFQQGLKACGVFTQVQLNGISPPSGGRPRASFSLTLSLNGGEGEQP